MCKRYFFIRAMIVLCAFGGYSYAMQEGYEYADINNAFRVQLNTKLINAIRAGKLDDVFKHMQDMKLLLIPINYQDAYGRTALMEAARNGYLDIVVELLKRSNVSYLNSVDSDGMTALMHAVFSRHADIVLALLKERGIKVNLRLPGGRTALTLSVLTGQLNMVQALLSVPGIGLNYPGPDGRTALLEALVISRFDIVEALLSVPGIEVNYCGPDGRTELMFAVLAERSDIVQKILAVPGIDVARTDAAGDTALDLAKTEDIKTLIFNKAKEAPVIGAGAAALNQTIAGTDTVMRDALLSVEAQIPAAEDSLYENNVNLRDNEDADQLRYAAQRGDIAGMKRLLACDNIEVNQADYQGATALMYAAERGNIDVIEILLNVDGIEVNQGDNKGNTALHYAARAGQINMVKLLLNVPDIRINQPNFAGQSALALAAENAYESMIHRWPLSVSYIRKDAYFVIMRAFLAMPHINVNLPRFGRHLRWPNDYANTVLMIAFYRKDFEFVRELLAMPFIDIDVKNMHGDSARPLLEGLNTAPMIGAGAGAWSQCSAGDAFAAAREQPASANNELIDAARSGDIARLNRCLAVPEVDVNYPDEKSKTALMYAAEAGYIDVIDALLAVDGIDVNQPDRQGINALIMACQASQIAAITELSEVQGINVNHGDRDDKTALMYAAEAGLLDVVNVLLQVHNIDVNARDQGDEGKPALVFAAENGHIKVVQALLAMPGIDVNHYDFLMGEGYTALMIFAQRGNSDLVREILQVPDADVNTGGRHEETALMCAAGAGQVDIVHMLLDAGADVNQRDVAHDTALMSAAANRHVEVVRVLLAVPGIDVTCQNEEGMTAIDLAATEEIRQLILSRALPTPLSAAAPRGHVLRRVHVRRMQL